MAKRKKKPKKKTVNQPPTISLCMIAKNEAAFLAQCLDSVKSIVSEIVLVDTGSTDDTVRIAEEYGAIVLHRPWDNDFSAPRNLSIQHATGDWILILDADEAIATSDLKELQALTRKKNRAFEFLQRHYSNDQRLSAFEPCRGEYPEWERNYGGYFTSNLCRLFPNHHQFEYRNRVHELVEHSIHENKHFVIERTRIPIHHYGHTPEVRAKKKKTSLYTPLGARKVQEDPLNWKNHYELAVENNCNDRKLESVFSFRTAAALNPGYVQTWVNLGYVLNELRAFGSALEALNRALRLEPESAEAHCNIAVTYMRLQRPMFAESHLRRALEIKPTYVNALCNLGQVYYQNRRLADAEQCYRKALDMFPKNVHALADLGGILMEQEKLDESLSILTKASSLDPHFARCQYYLGIAQFKNKQTANAIETLKDLCGRLENSQDPSISILEVEKTCRIFEQSLQSMK